MREGLYRNNLPWTKQYEKKQVSADEAARMIQDNDHICLAGGASIPRAFQESLCKMVIDLDYHNVDIIVSFVIESYEFMSAKYKDKFTISSGFMAKERECIKNGNMLLTPFNLGEYGRWLDELKPRVFAFSCSPPDEDGWMSRSSWGALASRRAFGNSGTELVIVEVNKNLPFLCGNLPNHLKIHVSEVDYIIENDFEYAEIKPIEASTNEKAIAQYIADLVDDGSCVQFGLGGMADAIGSFLVDAGKKDLGLHTEVVGNSVAQLMKMGVINNSRKNFNPGLSIGSFLIGDRKLADFVNFNKDFCFCEIEYINDPNIICQNDKVISVNNALEIDLTGQVCSEAVGHRQYSGTGGQLAWVTAAQRSRGGKSFIAINSSYRDKEGNLQSKIKSVLPPGSIISTPRTCVQYIVTEYGIADLKFKTWRQRAKSLINLAHPDFRDRLTYDAKKLGWL